MTSRDCKRNVKNCALKGVLRELELARDDDREQMEKDSWNVMLAEAASFGDEFYDYDGSITSVAANSMCF
jgi:hypothetical protein